MKVNAASHPFWPDDASNIPDSAQHRQTRAALRGTSNRENSQQSPAAIANASVSQKTAPPSPPNGSVASPAGKEIDAETHAIAAQAVIGNEIAADMETFNASLGKVDEDVERGGNTTADMIEAASAYNQAQQVGALDKPTPELQSKIARVETALRDSKGDESLGTIGQKAGVDLSALTHQPDAASTYGKYGKAASTYTRALIFDEARFNNSAVLKNTPLAALQRPNQSVLDPLGPYGRLGTLTGTRLNSAASYFTKGGLSFLSGMEKLRKGQDPTKDFVTAGATTGQGINELTVGIGTDVGNHLVKLRQTKAAAQIAGGQSTGTGGSARPATPGQSGVTQGVAEPVAGPSRTAEFTDFDSHGKDDAEIDTFEKKTAEHIDEQLTQQQQSLRESVIAKLEKTNRDVQQLELKDATDDLAPQYFEMQDMAKKFKDSTADAANDAHENIKTIDAKAQDVIAKLKNQGFDTADAARQSGKPEAIELGNQLDRLAGLKHAAYDQFNSAMQERENALSDTRTAFGELGKLLKDTPASERPSKLKEWSDKYTDFFAQRQANILSKTDGWPDWMKISKPLRMQMVPAAINTVLGGATFGVSLDTYLKKQQAGKLTPQDKMDLAASVINLSSGMIGFVPVIGPALSFALATAGLIVGGMSDQYDARKRETDTYNLKEKIREEYNAKHPDKQIAEPFDGD
ncbi:hypothetical protein NE850_34945 [Paraburkholderia sp. USG1]|uniref:hypothetical protein n=1 Tax=Paraburkholderia sp. USG1 TaxID=2952268 RepID=UPI0028560AC7|nr:hypothetical protein [Paraburkholderia sp. USG1]MDR8401532.1 hypothetical protein [Paraburkholderia sp. USG1]